MRTSLSSIAALAMAAVVPAQAHHSNVIFDLGAVTTVRGTVTRYDWRNPHVYVFVAVQDASGAAVEWQIEADPTPIMARSGWDRATLAPGDAVTIRAHPDATGRPDHGLLISLAKPDGVFLTMRSGGREASVAAATIEGVWDGLRGTKERSFEYGALTEKGRAAQAEYTESMNPVIDCVPFPSPTIVAAPYLYEVELRADRIIIRTELFHVEHTIWMDGRGHRA
ncbi:MAG TPA: DUF6152 family protein, partial [Gammaproteobacteria bacterium]|nr:DUF6152 family protein [Gammaproteobacteria bacterium]